MKMKNKQKGVVLLSALVFLIVLLTFLRFSLGSAKLSELKAGADYDDLLAREAAFMTLKNAEDEMNKFISSSSSGTGFYKNGQQLPSNLDWRSLDCGGSSGFACFKDQTKLGNKNITVGNLVGKYIIEQKIENGGNVVKITVAGHSIYKQGIRATGSNPGVNQANIVNDRKDNFTTVVLQAVYRPEVVSSTSVVWGPKINVFNGNQGQDNHNKKEIPTKLYECTITEVGGVIVAMAKTDGTSLADTTGGSGDYINPAFCDAKVSKYYNNQHLANLTIQSALGTAVTSGGVATNKLVRVSLRELSDF